MKKSKEFSLITGLLMCYFLMAYLIQIKNIKTIPYVEFLTIPFFAIGFLYGFLKLFKNRENQIILFSFIYVFVLTFVLIATNLTVVSSTFSILRGGFAGILFGLMLITFLYVAFKFEKSNYWSNFLINTFIIILLIAIIGQLLISSWGWGVRLAGGINPNVVGFFGLFVIFLSHYLGAKREKWDKRLILSWILGLMVMIWSFSRMVIFSFLVFYFFYYFLLFLKLFLIGKINRSLVRGAMVLLMVVALVFLLNPFLLSEETIIQIERRITGPTGRIMEDSNAVERINEFKFLMKQTAKNPFTGYLGWWNASRELAKLDIKNMTRATHNLYTRLLSEVGVIGAFAVLFFPFFIFISLLFKKIKKEKEGHKTQLLTAFILAIFISQFFSNYYMTGIADLQWGIIMFVLALGLINLKKKMNKK
jgi:hypothetical protein